MNFPRLASVPLLMQLASSLIVFFGVGGYYFGDTHGDLMHTSHFEGGEMIFRNPAFPALLDLIGHVFPPGGRTTVLFVIHHLLLLLGVWLLQATMTRLGRPLLGLAASVLLVLAFRQTVLAQFIQTETLFLTLVLLAILLLFETRRSIAGDRRQAWFLLLSFGLVAGLAQVTRMVGIAVLVPAALVLGRELWIKHRWQAVFPLCWVGVGILAANLGGMLYHSQVNGRFLLLEQKGSHLMNHVAHYHESLHPSPEARDIEAAAAAIGKPIYQTEIWDLHRQLSEDYGKDAAKADRVLGKAAKQTMLADPGKAISDNWEALATVTQPVRIDWLFTGLGEGWTDASHATYHQRLNPAQKFTDAWPVDPPATDSLNPLIAALGENPVATLSRGRYVIHTLIALGLVGLFCWFRDPARCETLIFAGTAAGMVVVAVATEIPLTRFWEPSAPLFLLALVCAASDLGNLVLKKLGLRIATAEGGNG